MAETTGGFEAFYRQHFPKIMGTAYLATGNREEAHDVAQETFVRALERWDGLQRHEEPLAWLYAVAGNIAITGHRRRKLRRLLPDETTVEGPEPPDTALMSALLSLTPAQRMVVVLRYYCDQSIEQVAAALGKKEGTVRALTSQALARLRRDPRVELVQK